MRGFGERKFWIVRTILVITLIIAFVFASGCLDFFKSFGGTKTGAQTTLTPTGTPAKDITQITQALGTPTPGSGDGTGGSGSGSGGTCCERDISSSDMNLPQVFSHIKEWTNWFGGGFTKAFNKYEDQHGCPSIGFFNINANADYTWAGTLKVDNVVGKPGDESWSRQCWNPELCDDIPDGDYTFTMKLVDPWHGNTVLKEGSVSWKGGVDDGLYHAVYFINPTTNVEDVKFVDPIGDFAQTFKPLDKIIRDYEQMPLSAEIHPEKDEVDTGEKIDVTVENLKDENGRAPQPFQRVLVKAEKGEILGGTQAGEYKVFNAEGSSVTLQYKAPDNCDKKSSDTLTVYNSCDQHSTIYQIYEGVIYSTSAGTSGDIP